MTTEIRLQKSYTRYGLLHLPSAQYVMSHNIQPRIMLFKSVQKAHRGLSILAPTAGFGHMLRLEHETLNFTSFKTTKTLNAFYRQFEPVKLLCLVRFQNGDKILHIYQDINTSSPKDLGILLSDIATVQELKYFYSNPDRILKTALVS